MSTLRAKTAQSEFDYTLLVLIAILIGFGLIMVFSASYAFSYVNTNNALYFFLRQVIWTALGVIAMIIMLSIDYRSWRNLALPIMIFTIALLVLVLIIGQTRFGRCANSSKALANPRSLPRYRSSSMWRHG